MKISISCLLALVLVLTSGCTDKHLITNKEYRILSEKLFTERKQLAANRELALFEVFKRDLSVKQKEALQFLFAYMPLSDLADYTGDFFLANANMSLRVREESSWGMHIPEEIFLHYVLPCRINNENLDSFRIVFYDEIMSRIKGKGVTEAALEINHWCHEKVNYQPSDSRTSSPINTILSARGRCGEESTFTVAALRTAGIPARQVYTPRWAHSDDNHAWVEIWDNGKWYYMGACEPEPIPDLGWFTESARRAMLVHTKSFGALLGNENTINVHKNFTEVNNLSKYAVTKRIYVKVINNEGAPVSNAIVEYQLYNYAEFYPLAVVPTDINGISTFETGLGDLLVWAYLKDHFNYKKISVSETDTLVIKIDRNPEDEYITDLDLDVPVVRSPLPGPPSKLTEDNSERINDENIIRQKYVDSWITPEEAKKVALSLDLDTLQIMKIFKRSMGNYKEIKSFLKNTPHSLLPLALLLIESLPDKDLRDIKGSILSDHLLNTDIPAGFIGEGAKYIFINYILNPRIANENIVAWRRYLIDNLPANLKDQAYSDPFVIVNYLDENIKIADDENYYKTPLTPRGVYELKVSDKGSRSLCFVAICRSMGIASRLEPGRKVPQYFLNDRWNDVYFSDQDQPSSEKGYIKFESFEIIPVPEYNIHFTLARFENGRYNTLEYNNKRINEFKEELSLPPGHYMLVSGNRLNNGRILAEISFFNLAENEHKTVKVKIRRDSSEDYILGKIDMKKIYSLFGNFNINEDRISEKGVAIVWIEPEKEPTKHVFNDLPSVKSELDKWGGYFLFLSASGQGKNLFKPESLTGLPANSLFGYDDQLNVLRSFNDLKISSDIGLPYIILSDKNGNILFTSSGYRIGIGEQILKRIN